jgi:hypothetical protein
LFNVISSLFFSMWYSLSLVFVWHSFVLGWMWNWNRFCRMRARVCELPVMTINWALRVARLYLWPKRLCQIQWWSRIMKCIIKISYLFCESLKIDLKCRWRSTDKNISQFKFPPTRYFQTNSFWCASISFLVLHQAASLHPSIHFSCFTCNEIWRAHDEYSSLRSYNRFP